MSTRPNPPRTPSAQLEIAAQWLAEAATTTADRDLKANFERVARDCLHVARDCIRIAA